MNFYFFIAVQLFSCSPSYLFLAKNKDAMKNFRKKDWAKHSWKKQITPSLLADNLGTTKKDCYINNQAILSVNQEFGPTKIDF